MRAIPTVAINMLKSFEDLRLSPYLDGSGIWTVGYGHTRSVDPHTPITLAQAECFLHDDAMAALGAVERLVTAPLTDNQLAALIDFTFNLGAGALAASTLLRVVNHEQYDLAADEFPRWVHDHTGAVERGLVTRRLAEQALWRTR
jgi:lysozyme